MIVDIWDLKKLLTRYQERARARSEERRNINDDTPFEMRVLQEILIDVLNEHEILKRMYEVQAGEPFDMARAIEVEKVKRAEAAAEAKRVEREEAERVAAANAAARKSRPAPLPSI